MLEDIKLSENVILIDVAFLNEFVRSAKSFLSTRLGRELPNVDLPAWLSYMALDAGLKVGESKLEVILLHDQAVHTLSCCEPSDLDHLGSLACRTPVGEYLFSSVSSSGIVSTEELYLDLMNIALDSTDVKCLMLLPFHPVYGDKVEEKLCRFFKNKKEEERSRAVYFTMEETSQPIYCRQEPVSYSLAHAFGINPDEL